ncbi:MAG: restriction endonuclease, partial [Bacteroidales bacterium]|nr:restriction endonuclease [Bacteroidales bacterium]
EGWDCPFAYILASLADKSSAVDVEQILGRVLRQPYVMQHSAPLLNISYVLTASERFNETLQNIVKGLQASGFSEKDYRDKDDMPEEVKNKIIEKPLESFLFPERLGEMANAEEEIEVDRISYNPDSVNTPEKKISAIAEIESMAEEQNREMDAEIEKQNQQPIDENIFQEMGDKVKRYRIVDVNKDIASKIKLPQFFLQVQQSDVFGTDTILLNQESLLKDFKLGSEDSKIDFDQISSDLYKVDIEQIKKDEYAPRFTKIEDMRVKDPIVEYILAKPKDGQIKDIAYQIVQLVGNLYPIPDQEIRIYVERILNQLNPEQLQDILVRKLSYSDKIKAKIRIHADSYAESRFNDLIKIGKVSTAPAWNFSEMIVPGSLGASIGNSLYEREGAMNNFESTVITDIASLPNISFWHRNLGRGKGFSINGFQSNHYPDFIAVSKSGKVIIIETKGDDRDNSDSAAKCRLGNKWAELAGRNFLYFMVFDKKDIAGAYTVDKAKELIRQL